MRKGMCALIVLSAGVILWPAFGAEAKKDNLPRLPGALLLMGYLRDKVILTTLTETWNLQQSEDQSAFYPSMSRDGNTIASGRVKAGNPTTLVLQTYSRKEMAWVDIKEVRHGGSLVISPGGTKLAIAHYDDGPGSSVRLQVIDLETKAEAISLLIGRNAGSTLSWSPDGSRIAFDVEPRYRSTIHILDVQTGVISKIAEGELPAWSPDGDWIAHLDNTRQRIWLMRPDGTDAKLLATVGTRRIWLRSVYRRLRFAPVWSPDSKTLLLNELANADTYVFDILLLDLSTLRLARKFKNTVPVHGWAEAK